MKEIIIISLSLLCLYLTYSAMSLFLIQADQAAFNRYNDGVQKAWEQRMAEQDALARQLDSVAVDKSESQISIGKNAATVSAN